MLFPLPEITSCTIQFYLSKFSLYLSSLVYSLTIQTQQTVSPLSKPPETTLTLFLNVSYLLLFVYSFYDAAGR